jgi:hypothetical protein
LTTDGGSISNYRLTPPSILRYLLWCESPLPRAASIDEFALQWRLPFEVTRSYLEQLVSERIVHVEVDIHTLDVLAPFDCKVDIDHLVDSLFLPPSEGGDQGGPALDG